MSLTTGQHCSKGYIGPSLFVESLLADRCGAEPCLHHCRSRCNRWCQRLATSMCRGPDSENSFRLCTHATFFWCRRTQRRTKAHLHSTAKLLMHCAALEVEDASPPRAELLPPPGRAEAHKGPLERQLTGKKRSPRAQHMQPKGHLAGLVKGKLKGRAAVAVGSHPGVTAALLSTVPSRLL